MDHETQHGTVRQRLQYLKCVQCRKDKKKCSPLERSWPDQKCDRCARHRYACSASMTTKQEREASRGVSSSQLLSRASGCHTWGSGSATAGIEQHDQLFGTTESANSSSCRPKCAVYFSSLIEANWVEFGSNSSASASLGETLLADMFRFFLSYNAKQVWHRLNERLAMIELAKHYTKGVEDGLSKGMPSEDAKLFSSRKMMFEAGNQSGKLPYDKIIQGFDQRISFALEWKNLLAAVGVPEVLLIHFEYDELDWDNELPFSPTDFQSKDEGRCPLSELLDPRLGLKETCLRLSGVVDMIQRLAELDRSELKTFLAEEVKKRVRDVFGDPVYSEHESDPEEDSDGDVDGDETMADAA